MYYLKRRWNRNPVHKFYRSKNIPFVSKIEDSADHLLILPEVCTKLLVKYYKIRKVLWWLSVDNYTNDFRKLSLPKKTFSHVSEINFQKIIFGKEDLKSALWSWIECENLNEKEKAAYEQLKYQPSTIRKIKNWINYLLYKDKVNGFQIHKHWVQSYYAKDFLLKQGVVDVAFLSDYLDPIFIKELEGKSFNDLTKKNIILYNPKKGFEITKQLMEKSPHIQWVPLEYMTPQQVKEQLIAAKIYLDFGTHPGKDRIPREAAMCGCIVITNRKGSAFFNEDVPILDTYKIDYEPGKDESIIQFFTECFNEYEKRIVDFDAYRLKIKGEEDQFNDDLHKLFTLNSI